MINNLNEIVFIDTLHFQFVQGVTHADARGIPTGHDVPEAFMVGDVVRSDDCRVIALFLY